MKHGHCGPKKSKTYTGWRCMKARCGNKKNNNYKHYGDRGIKICERWMTFENFLADMGERPEGAQLDRIDMDGNYEPGNCRWVSVSANLKNRRKRAAIQSMHDGVTWNSLCKKWQTTIVKRCASEEEAANLTKALKLFVKEWENERG